MNRSKYWLPELALGALALVASMGGCSATQSPDVSAGVRHALDDAGLKNVSVSQDRQKGVVTLTGTVPADADKAQADSIAKSNAGGQVVANEVAVVPPQGNDASAVNSDLDKGIQENLDAALLQNRLNNQISFSVKNAVVTLKGEVNSEAVRDQATKIAKAVPNVQEVVNELQLKDIKATANR